jgi:hypothetical protein
LLPESIYLFLFLWHAMSRKSSHDADLKVSPDHVEQAPAVVQIETFRVLGLDSADADFYNNFGEEKRKKLVRKVCLC